MPSDACKAVRRWPLAASWLTRKSWRRSDQQNPVHQGNGGKGLQYQFRLSGIQVGMQIMHQISSIVLHFPA
jgi:hypothetical protein